MRESAKQKTLHGGRMEYFLELLSVLFWRLNPPWRRGRGDSGSMYQILILSVSISYSWSSLNCHSRKWTAILKAALAKPLFGSHTNFVFTHSGKRPAPVRVSTYRGFDCIYYLKTSLLTNFWIIHVNCSINLVVSFTRFSHNSGNESLVSNYHGGNYYLQGKISNLNGVRSFKHLYLEQFLKYLCPRTKTKALKTSLSHWFYHD